MRQSFSYDQEVIMNVMKHHSIENVILVDEFTIKSTLENILYFIKLDEYLRVWGCENFEKTNIRFILELKTGNREDFFPSIIKFQEHVKACNF